MSKLTQSTTVGTRSSNPSYRIVQVVCILVVALVIVSPLLLLLVGSLKDDRFQIIAELGTWKAFWVANPTLSNFAEISGLSGPSGFGRYVINSLIVLAGTVGLGLVINSMAGFVLAWGSLPGRAIIIAMMIGLFIVPQESLVLPLLLTVVRLGLNDTLIAQIIPFVASPLYTFLFYQFFAQLPKDLFEAAQVDGASIFRTYRSVFLPLSLPAIAAVSILMGIDSWNQYLWPVLVSQSNDTRPIAVAIGSFFELSDTYWDQALAASVMMMAPMLLLYLAFQRWFVSSFIGSAVKG